MFVGVLLYVPGQAQANTIVFPSYGEPHLLGPGGILDTLYPGGFTRVGDSIDQLWAPGGGAVTVTATVVAKYAGFNQDFGYIPGANGPGFTGLIPVATNCGPGSPCGLSTTFTITSPFRFADFAGGQLWSSLPTDNPHNEDHMVSFLTSTGSYVLAFEDVAFGGGAGHGGHHDHDGEHHRGHDSDDDHGRHDDRDGDGHDSDDEHGHHGKGHDDSDDGHGDHGDRDGDDHHGRGHHDSDDDHHGHHGHKGGHKDGSDRDYNDLVVQVDFQPVEPPPPIPEPATLGMLGLGLAAVAARRVLGG